MKLKQSKVFKAGIGYTIGNVMVKGINFLAIPIFSRLLTTEEMGVYTVFAAFPTLEALIWSYPISWLVTLLFQLGSYAVLQRK